MKRLHFFWPGPISSGAPRLGYRITATFCAGSLQSHTEVPVLGSLVMDYRVLGPCAEALAGEEWGERDIRACASRSHDEQRFAVACPGFAFGDHCVDLMGTVATQRDPGFGVLSRSSCANSWLSPSWFASRTSSSRRCLRTRGIGGAMESGRGIDVFRDKPRGRNSLRGCRRTHCEQSSPEAGVP
ncbi:hypothetical protein D3C87_1556370 [compost metagenome]